MNPAFIFLVLILAIFLWFCLSFLFKPIGRFFYRLWKDAKDIMKEEDKEKEDVEENK